MVNKAKSVQKKVSKLDPTSRLKATDKAVRGKLLYENRALACHGKTVEEAVRLTIDGAKYRMADLRYDLKGGRLALLKKGQAAGPKPLSERSKAPRTGKSMPEATLDEFFQFCSCQLQIEGREIMEKDIPLKDADAEALFPHVHEHVKPNLGNTERWVPYHTVLGVHELFLMEAVHSRTDWTEKQKFLAIFVFRAHCKRDLFSQAQVPLMKKEFWKNPVKAFEPEGRMEKAILSYRKKTGNPLLTNCFRIIPERVLKDNDANLVRSIVTRSARLLKMADKAYEVVQNKKLSAKDKLADISEMIQSTEGCGDTWAKMLTVCIDLAYPKEKILDADCDVGVGAAPPLQCLLGNAKLPDRRSALRELLGKVNKSQSASAKHFWKYLTEVETSMRQKFRHLPLVVKQADTKKHHMSASTLQVQLCEYRQFRHTWARNVYGLPDDATMRTEETTRFQAEDALSNDKTSVNCEFRHDGRTVKLSVNIKAFQSLKVAQRVAIMMMQQVKSGASEKEAAKFRDELAKDYVQGKDVKDSSEAWKYCKVQLSHPSPLVAFVFHKKDGTNFPFQTTVKAAGNVLQAERIARLCWEMLQSGKNKDAVLKYRDELYKMAGGSSARKRKHEE
ncbi:unnamed protein product [Durusdinium trenchii]|uniref:Uncharacterized protein n=2 Tax=Durusdinium trenchii TaxID=1381693 RepID=A0ABP0HCY0_9DINO